MFRKHINNHLVKSTKRYATQGITLMVLALLLGACGAQEGATPNVAVGQATIEAFPTINLAPTLEVAPTVELPPVETAPTVVVPTLGTAPTANLVPTVEAGPTAMVMPAAGQALRVSQIMSNPDAYIGQQVTVVGEAEQIFNSSAFKLDEDAFFGAGVDNDLLVISAQQNNPAVDQGWLNNVVQVTGTVRRYVKADFDRDYNLLTLSPEVEATFEGKTALVADSVNVVEPGAAAVAPIATTGPIPDAPEGTLSVADVTGNLSSFTGQTVTVQGEAEEFYNPNTLKLDDNSIFAGGIDNDLLVISAQQARPTMDNGWLNSQVRVTGVVRQFDRATIEQEIGYQLGDLSIFNDWNGKPVLVAQSVEAVQ